MKKHILIAGANQHFRDESAALGSTFEFTVIGAAEDGEAVLCEPWKASYYVYLMGMTKEEPAERHCFCQHGGGGVSVRAKGDRELWLLPQNQDRHPDAPIFELIMD